MKDNISPVFVSDIFDTFIFWQLIWTTLKEGMEYFLLKWHYGPEILIPVLQLNPLLSNIYIISVERLEFWWPLDRRWLWSNISGIDWNNWMGCKKWSCNFRPDVYKQSIPRTSELYWKQGNFTGRKCDILAYGWIN